MISVNAIGYGKRECLWFFIYAPEKYLPEIPALFGQDPKNYYRLYNCHKLIERQRFRARRILFFMENLQLAY